MSNPSLILPQSPAYGEDYVYAAQVEDGAVPLYNVLPLTFTRASGGTRINKDGLVQNMPYNLLSYSEEFNNTSGWTPDANGGSITITANYGVSPNGTTTADRIQITKGPSYSQIFQTSSVISGAVYTISVYLKSLSGTPTITTLYDGTEKGTKTLTTAWARYEFSFTATSSTVYPMIALYTGNSASMDILAWGFQLNIGSTAQPYLATTDRLNMPRITYPVGGGCGALLLEKQSTNLNLYSQDLSNAVYVSGGSGGTITRTANYGISPDGTQNATRIQISRNTGATSYAEIYQRISVTVGTTYTLSFYAKSLSGTPTLITAFNDGYFNEVTFTTNWVKYTYTFVATGAFGSGLNLLTYTPFTNTSASADLLIWGVQLEASSYATSYIPTTSTSATRIADACYKTGISNLIGQTEGTMFVDVNVNITGNAGSSAGIAINDGTSSNVIAFGYYQNGRIQAASFVSGSLVVNIDLPSFGLTSGRHKFALAYKLNDYVFYVDGVQVGSDTSASVPATSVLLLSDIVGADIFYNQAELYKTRLTNAELATLTTL